MSNGFPVFVSAGRLYASASTPDSARWGIGQWRTFDWDAQVGPQVGERVRDRVALFRELASQLRTGGATHGNICEAALRRTGPGPEFNLVGFGLGEAYREWRVLHGLIVGDSTLDPRFAPAGALVACESGRIVDLHMLWRLCWQLAAPKPDEMPKYWASNQELSQARCVDLRTIFGWQELAWRDADAAFAKLLTVELPGTKLHPVGPAGRFGPDDGQRPEARPGPGVDEGAAANVARKRLVSAGSVAAAVIVVAVSAAVLATQFIGSNTEPAPAEATSGSGSMGEASGDDRTAAQPTSAVGAETDRQGDDAEVTVTETDVAGDTVEPEQAIEDASAWLLENTVWVCCHLAGPGETDICERDANGSPTILTITQSRSQFTPDTLTNTGNRIQNIAVRAYGRLEATERGERFMMEVPPGTVDAVNATVPPGVVDAVNATRPRGSTIAAALSGDCRPNGWRLVARQTPNRATPAAGR